MPKMNDFIVQSDLDLLLNNPYFVISIALLATCLLIFKRICMKILLSSIRQAGFDTKNIAIIGVNRQAINLVNEFSRHQEYGFIVKGVFNTNSNNEKTKIFYNETEISEIIYDLSQFQDFIIKNNIDEVFITFDPNKIKNFESIVNFLNFTGISYHFTISTGISKIENKSEFKVVADEYYGMPMTSYHSVPANIYSLVLKSVVEKMLALLLIIFTLPVSIITAILIKFSSPGAIFFKQERVGLRGRTFKQYKFRSMTEDADSRKKDLEHLNEQSGPVFKITNDPRLTKVGKYIRKFSIDELPQLINVIIGNMSLIGPRPPIPNEVKEYSTIHRRRLSMKPGITGLWQVSGRNSIQNFEDWVKIDLSYIDNWSFWLDIKIALKTIFVVISGTGK